MNFLIIDSGSHNDTDNLMAIYATNRDYSKYKFYYLYFASPLTYALFEDLSGLIKGINTRDFSNALHVTHSAYPEDDQGYDEMIDFLHAYNFQYPH